MSKKKSNQKQTNRKEPSKNKEPWTRKFVEEESSKSKQYSRSARKTKSDEVAPLYKVVFFLFLALLIIPFATIYWNDRTKAAPAPKTPEQVMVNKKGTSSSAESEANSSSESKEIADTSSEESESKDESVEKESKSEPAEVETPPESTEPEVIPPVEPTVPETTPETEPEGEYNNTYTVQAGDNLYRIALNHGMDLEILKSINGLSSNIAEIGEVLKVK